MAINASIALQGHGIEVPNPLAQYAQLAQIQGAQNQNALAQYQLSAAQRNDETANAMNRAWSSAIDPNTGEVNYSTLTNALAQANAGSKIPEILKQADEAKEAKAKRQKMEVELVDKKLQQSRQLLEGIDPTAPGAAQQFIMWHEGNHKDLVLGPVLAARGITADQSRERIMAALNTPGGLARLINEAKLGVEKFAEQNKPHYIAQDNGGTNQVISMPGLGGPATVVPGSVAKKTMTPYQQQELQLQRDRLKQETATGEYTPQTIDFLAQTYKQTGQLPALGMGKGAATLRQKVFDRAAQLGMEGGVSAADAAEEVKDAKINTAAQSKAVKDFSTGTQGRQVNSFNTAIDHLATMDKLADALANGDVKLVNSIGNTVTRWTGGAAPTNFEAAKQIVSAEVIKTIVANGGSMAERQEASDKFSNANSPAQLKGVIKTYKHLLGGQLNSLQLQYENGTGRKDFHTKLTSAAKTTMKELRGDAAPATANIPMQNGKGWTLHTDANGNRAYVSPDGKQFEEVK